jgi:hypothetical protein
MMTRFSNQRVRLSLVVALGVLVTLLSIEPASAQRVPWSDTTGDMWLVDDTSGATTAAPDATNGDIRRVSVNYRNKSVLLRTRFVDLRRTGDSLGLKGDVRTSDGRTWHFFVGAGPGRWQGTAELLGPNFAHVSCGLLFHFDYALNVISLRTPTSCLRRPRWVKVEFSSLHAFFDRRQIYEDDAMSDGVGPVWSPRIHRG